MPFVVVVSKQSVVVDCCFDMGSLEMNVPFRKRITSRGIDFIRRRADERVDEVIDDFKRSVSLLLVELKPSVVVFESIRVASSAMITTLALGSAPVAFSRRLAAVLFRDAPRDVTRPPRLNFFPFSTRAGTIGTDDWMGTDERGGVVVVVYACPMVFPLM